MEKKNETTATANLVKRLTDGKKMDGGISPFLGAISSNVKRDNINDVFDPIWGKVLKRICLVREKYKENTSKDFPLESFLVTFSKNHGIDLQENNANDYNIELEDENEIIFNEWRCKLLNIFFILTGSYSSQVNSNFIFPSDLLFNIQEINNFDELLNLFEEIVSEEKLTKLYSKSKTFINLFPFDKIREKLNFICCKIVNSVIKSNEEREELKEKHKVLFDCKNKDKELKCKFKHHCQSMITLGEIKWIKELLWWSLRYDVPVYPTTPELAHYFSFFINPYDHKDVRDNELMKVTEKIGEADEETCLTKLKLILETITSERKKNEYLSDFYAKKSLDFFKSNEISHLLLRDITKYFEAKNIKKPLIVTTNYDGMIEAAIEMHLCKDEECQGIKGYNVIFPMIDSKLTEIKWICKTYMNNQIPYYFDIDNVPEENKEFLKIVESSKNFPTILKLHGNPLLSTDEVISGIRMHNESFVSKIEHFAVLKESDYLKSLFLNLNKREIGKLLFGVNRGFWFLGYSVSDWNVRSMIYQNKNRKETEEIRFSTINFDIVTHFEDSYHNAFLENLDIVTHKTNFDEFRTQLI